MTGREYYPEIFRRKSFHLFRDTGSDKISGEELEEIRAAWDSFGKLCPDIRTGIRIVPAKDVNFKRDAEYCILIYSENKENRLMNAGYLGEQLDLYLVSRNIGTLWYGLGNPDEPTYDGMDFVIMMAVHKISDESKFRKDMFKAKRKSLGEIWSGDTLGIGEIARFAPSACNSQPWLVKNTGDTLEITRYKKQARVGIMSPAKAFYYNRIDMGIFLCILEVCLAEKGIRTERTLFADSLDVEYSPVASYRLLPGQGE